MRDDALLQVRGLSMSYHDGRVSHPVFSNLDLRIEAGEWVALLGPSGCGKSTLLNLISGLDLPDAGSVRLAGTELSGLDETARTRLRRRHIGFVFQFFNLIPTLTVAENVLLPLELNRLDHPARRAEAMDLLSRVGLAGREHSFPEQLSGGEQQRLAMVRALVHHPALVLADEPTGNLDGETGEQVLEVLTELRAQTGSAMLMVTHSETVAARAGRVLRLEDGQLSSAQLSGAD